MWGFVSDLLKDPDRLRVGLECMIEQERAGIREDPDQQAATWVKKHLILGDLLSSFELLNSLTTVDRIWAGKAKGRGIACLAHIKRLKVRHDANQRGVLRNRNNPVGSAFRLIQTDYNTSPTEE